MASIWRTTSSRRGRLELAAGITAIVAGLALVVVVPQLRHCVWLALHGQFEALRNYIRSLGAGGFALLLGLMLAHAIILYPSEVVTATAAYVFGFLPSLAFVVVGWLLAALLSYALGRAVGRPLLRAVLGHRFIRLERGMDRGGISLLLSGRLIPVVPFALLGYAAGATRVSVWRFSWTTVLGYLPLTTAVVYLGSRAQTLSTSDPLVWLAVAALVSALVLERVIRRRSGGRGRASVFTSWPRQSSSDGPGHVDDRSTAAEDRETAAVPCAPGAHPSPPSRHDHG